MILKDEIDDCIQMILYCIVFLINPFFELVLWFLNKTRKNLELLIKKLIILLLFFWTNYHFLIMIV